MRPNKKHEEEQYINELEISITKDIIAFVEKYHIVSYSAISTISHDYRTDWSWFLKRGGRQIIHSYIESKRRMWIAEGSAVGFCEASRRGTIEMFNLDEVIERIDKEDLVPIFDEQISIVR